MTEKDYNDASNALIDWFKSQSIKPADGTVIMIKVMATQLVAKSSKLEDLSRAIILTHEILAIEVASELRKY